MPLLVFSALCFYGEAENDWLIWGLGMSIILAGFFLRVWAQQHIQRRLGFAKHLTTTGPYAFVRNPLYIGNMLLLVGATVLSELLWLVPLGHPTSVCLRQS